MNDFSFEVPATLRGIKLNQWQKYIDIYEKNKEAENTEFLDKKLLSIFCNIDFKDIDSLGLEVFYSTIQHISNLLNQKTDLVQRLIRIIIKLWQFFTDQLNSRVKISILYTITRVQSIWLM